MIMIDLGTGNNNKINWAFNNKQELIDIIEVVYRRVHLWRRAQCVHCVLMLCLRVLVQRRAQGARPGCLPEGLLHQVQILELESGCCYAQVSLGYAPEHKCLRV